MTKLLEVLFRLVSSLSTLKSLGRGGKVNFDAKKPLRSLFFVFGEMDTVYGKKKNKTEIPIYIFCGTYDIEPLLLPR